MTKKKETKSKIQIAVPSHLIKAVRKVLYKDGLDKLIEISDIRCRDINTSSDEYILQYDCVEEDNGRYHFVLRGKTVLVKDEHAASYVSYFLREIIKHLTYAPIPEWSEEQNWNSTLKFMTA